MLDLVAKLMKIRNECFNLGHCLAHDSEDHDYEFMGLELLEINLILKEMQDLATAKAMMPSECRTTHSKPF